MKSTFFPLSPRFVSAVVISAVLGAAAFAQAPAAPGAAPAAPSEPPKPFQFSDETFVKNALKSMNYLVALANAAKTGVTDANLGHMRDSMASDLGTAVKDLSKIADAHGLKESAEVGGTDKIDLERLTKVKPDKFPKEWVEAVSKETKRLHRDMEAAAKDVQDDDLKTYVANYSPSIQGVVSNAETAEKAMKAAKK